MARKRYEFKPDRTDSGTLSKLYLTKKQQLSLLKWLLFALVLLLLSVIQDVMLCRLDIFGAGTDLVPCAIFLVCILQGAESGSVFCLVSSMIYLFSGSAPGYYAPVLITFLGVAACIFRQSYLQKGFGSTMLCAGTAMILYELAVFAVGVFLGLTTPGRVGVFVLTGVLSLIAAPVLYPVFQSIGKIGGESWKE